MSGARPTARALAQRIRNLGIDRWGVRARDSGESALPQLGAARRRAAWCSTSARSTATKSRRWSPRAVLGTLWERRAERQPVLIVIDEAHNVCPAAPQDALTALATDYAVRIAAEGRKFGLYLLVCTQRPQKVQENIISQCDNLVLMRMALGGRPRPRRRPAVVAPRHLLDGATSFKSARRWWPGKLASHPALIRFGTARGGGGRQRRRGRLGGLGRRVDGALAAPPGAVQQRARARAAPSRRRRRPCGRAGRGAHGGAGRRGSATGRRRTGSPTAAAEARARTPGGGINRSPWTPRTSIDMTRFPGVCPVVDQNREVGDAPDDRRHASGGHCHFWTSLVRL